MRINFIHLLLVEIEFSGQFWRILLKKFEHLKSFCDFLLFMVKCIFIFGVYLWLFADFGIVIRSLFIQLSWINNVRTTALVLDSQKCSGSKRPKNLIHFLHLQKKFLLLLSLNCFDRPFSSWKRHILRENFKSIKFKNRS